MTIFMNQKFKKKIKIFKCLTLIDNIRTEMHIDKFKISSSTEKR